MMKPIISIFPIEVDLSENMLNYSFPKAVKLEDAYKDFVEKNEESSETSEDNDEFLDTNEDLKDDKLIDLSLN